MTMLPFRLCSGAGRRPILFAFAAALYGGSASAFAAALPPASDAAFQASAGPGVLTAHQVGMMVATVLVFIMNLGFACLEAGLTRSKNTVNLLFKNAMVPCIALPLYAAVGFGLMYPGAEHAGGWFGFAGFGLDGNGVEAAADAHASGYWMRFLFQGMFAATAATIVSGAVAERIKFGSFLAFTALFVTFSYPVTGMWAWGHGWLKQLETPFHDFAGSALVHSVGGWSALAGVMLLGPRLGKYRDGRIHPILGHSMPLAAIGMFLLWFGWFGFNGGAALSADPDALSLVLVVTALGAAAGGVGATLTSWVVLKKPDLSMALNGVLGGLVGISAGADQFGPGHAVAIGAVAGVLVVFSIFFFDTRKLDDPVGALSVHLVGGTWGTLAVGLFGNLAGVGQLVSQAIGVLAVGGYTFGFALAVFAAIRRSLGLRVSADEEIEGLDLGEHGTEAYPDFTPAHKS